MATPKIEIAAERIAEGRRLYELTLTPVPDIAAMMGVSRRTLARRIDEWGWVPRAAPRHTTDRAFVAAAPDVAAVGADAGAIIAVSDPDQLRIANAMRIQTTVELTLDALQRVLDKVGPTDEGGTERSARTLAAVARTLQEMAPLTKPDEMAAPDETDDDPLPRDIDEIREELARRIHALIDAESGTDRARDSSGAAGVESAGRCDLSQ